MNNVNRWFMTRLNYLSDQELALKTISEELSHLERMVASGKTLSREDMKMLDGCITGAKRIRACLGASAGGPPSHNRKGYQGAKNPAAVGARRV